MTEVAETVCCRLDSGVFGKARAEFDWKMTNAIFMANLGMGD